MPNNIKPFKKILIAVDLTPESNHVTQTAHDLATAFDSEIYLIHVIEPFVMTYNNNSFVDFTPLEMELEKSAKNHLSNLGHVYHIKEDNQFVLFGKPAKEIHAFAERTGIDLIVIGTHGRHGVSLLLGSTANSVLHGSKCDVLAVRIN